MASYREYRNEHEEWDDSLWVIWGRGDTPPGHSLPSAPAANPEHVPADITEPDKNGKLRLKQGFWAKEYDCKWGTTFAYITKNFPKEIMGYRLMKSKPYRPTGEPAKTGTPPPRKVK